MLTILIVDDELPAIAAIAQRVNWEALGIGKVLTADSAQSARTLFMEEKIDLMLCDIEMPGESGLDLLDWVNRCYSTTVSIFLTCHADFTYAKQAVHMGAFEYLLKPALIEDIEDVVRRASGHYLKMQEQQKVQEHWQQTKDAAKVQFWQDVLRGRLSVSEKDAQALLEQRGIDFVLVGKYVPMLCSVRRWLGPKNQKDTEALNYAWENLLTELFTGNGDLPVVLPGDPGKKIVFIPVSGDTDLHPWIEIQCRKFTDILSRSFVGSEAFYRGGACFYVGQPTDFEGLAAAYEGLLRMERSNVAYDEQVFFMDDAPKSVQTDMKPVMEQWRSLMELGKEKDLKESIERYLQDAVCKKQMDSEFLQVFYHNFLQMVYGVLSGRDILAEQLLRGIDPKPEEALASVELMMVYTENVAAAAMGCITAVGRKNQMVEKVKEYIQEHIYEDISRDALARAVYLNPSYLSRLFGNETGTSLIDYITSQKLSEVVRLMGASDLSITEAAGRVGYTNMPYFSRVFKKKYGVTPAEYRKRE